MSTKTVKYSEAFKLQVVDDLESGRFRCPYEASRAYGIGGAVTVSRWVRQYGRSHLLKKVVRVEKSGEPRELKRLRDRARELEALVADLTMDRALAQAALAIHCEQYGDDPELFKKKAAASKFGGPVKKREGNEK